MVSVSFRSSISVNLVHAQHVRVLALLEVVPRRQILESGRRKAFRAGESHEGEAMLRRSLKSLPTRQIDDEAHSEREALRLTELNLPLPAYEMVMKASHTFNLLDARHAISVTERQRFILRVRTLARGVAQAYFDTRASLGFPMAEERLRQEFLAAANTEATP